MLRKNSYSNYLQKVFYQVRIKDELNQATDSVTGIAIRKRTVISFDI
ncbi:hypothetical protein [Nostoc sp. MG11]|nr:hypothetical protein [Nostoc sp. MG11]